VAEETDSSFEAEASDAEDEPSARPTRPRYFVNLVLFVLTVCSVFYAGAMYALGSAPIKDEKLLHGLLRVLPQSYKFALPLLAILVTHELGHFVAAKIHRVPASLPYFIPLPHLSPFGTMGAVISMPGRIRSRNALLDIGAAGPLAGLIVALPLWCIGIATSHVEVLGAHYTEEGQSILYLAIKYVLKGSIPAGSDLSMNSLAFAGWVGTLVTMLNLVPVGQLDGGHIAYALFGEKQNRYATWLHRSLLLVFAWNIVRFGIPALKAGSQDLFTQAIGNSAFWVVWFAIIAGMKRLAGVNHPPTDASTLSRGRRAIAVACLVIFVLLFMPTPWASY